MAWPLPVDPGLVLVAGFASLYLWYLIALSTILDKPLGKVRERWPMLIGCSFCAGFWIVAALLIATGRYDPLTHVAAAGLTGVVARWVS